MAILFGGSGLAFIVFGAAGHFRWEGTDSPAPRALPVLLGTAALLVGVYGFLLARNSRVELDDSGLRQFDFLGFATLECSWDEVRYAQIVRGDSESVDRLEVRVWEKLVRIELNFGDSEEFLREMRSRLGSRFLVEDWRGRS